MYYFVFYSEFNPNNQIQESDITKVSPNSSKIVRDTDINQDKFNELREIQFCKFPLMTSIKIAKNAKPEKKIRFLKMNFLVSEEFDFNPGKEIIIKIIATVDQYIISPA